MSITINMLLNVLFVLIPNQNVRNEFNCERSPFFLVGKHSYLNWLSPSSNSQVYEGIINSPFIAAQKIFLEGSQTAWKYDNTFSRRLQVSPIGNWCVFYAIVKSTCKQVYLVDGPFHSRNKSEKTRKLSKIGKLSNKGEFIHPSIH